VQAVLDVLREVGFSRAYWRELDGLNTTTPRSGCYWGSVLKSREALGRSCW